MSFVIEKGVPMPANKGTVKSGAADVLRQMEVGDSFVCTTKQRTTIHTLARMVGVKVAGRAVDAESVRFWRVE